jgi:hypothetical protein
MSYLDALSKSNAMDFDHLAKVIEDQNTPKKQSNNDDRFWKLELDKTGNGFATIRFLPPALVNGVPEDKLWVEIFSHGFKGPTGKWYIEKSLSTLKDPGLRDAISEYNNALWNSVGDDQPDHPNRKQARNQKRRQRYVSNILVVSDPKNPENEGKVFLFNYGKKIYDKLQAEMFPKNPNMKRLNPFDPVVGADFNVIVEQVGGFPNYDQSRFAAPAPLGSNDTIEEVCPKAYSLDDLVSPDKFKSKAELASLLDAVMGFDVAAATAHLRQNKAGGSAPVAPAARPIPTAETQVSTLSEEDDADLEEFKKLVA